MYKHTREVGRGEIKSYVIFMSLTVSITGFLANEATSLTRNSNLMKASSAFSAWRFLGNNPWEPRSRVSMLQLTYRVVFFFLKQHFISEAFTDINIRVIQAAVRNPPSLDRQMSDLVQRRGGRGVKVL